MTEQAQQPQQDPEWHFDGEVFADAGDVADSSTQPPAAETAERAEPEPVETKPAEPPPTAPDVLAALRSALDDRWAELADYLEGRRR